MVASQVAGGLLRVLPRPCNLKLVPHVRKLPNTDEMIASLPHSKSLNHRSHYVMKHQLLNSAP